MAYIRCGGSSEKGELATPTISSSGLITSGVSKKGIIDTSATKTLQLSTQGATTITPSTTAKTAVASGKYTTGAVTVSGDANLIASNILSGKSIFGVSGSVVSGVDLKSYFGCTQSAVTTITPTVDNRGWVQLPRAITNTPKYVVFSANSSSISTTGAYYLLQGVLKFKALSGWSQETDGYGVIMILNGTIYGGVGGTSCGWYRSDYGTPNLFSISPTYNHNGTNIPANYDCYFKSGIQYTFIQLG